ncbi:MAG TPA: hypothetical protein VLK84_06680 [Longimicrobium sp.]|nr:hypothetical protein [Longimicrobium sp.]
MKRIHWMAASVALALAAGADTGTASTASLPFTWDISNPVAGLPAYETCGHSVWYNQSSLPVDWAVNGVVVALDVNGINHTNDGSPYTLSVGQVSGGVFTASYSETFYPSELARPCKVM